MFKKLFKFLYNQKKSERAEKPPKAYVERIKRSSDFLETTSIDVTDSGSSLEPLIEVSRRQSMIEDHEFEKVQKTVMFSNVKQIEIN
ncbi:CLUMA_CG020420, isoform A [Clunio marinus]|uniref:CLUMA_CG020420, isoform A n=1 Tax=Clunio marinus TaxID=568069 RepID=A0A1J1J4W9_9DIPT|nr:CLUMA_CG020420, isoform A [Clunio marinus]